MKTLLAFLLLISSSAMAQDHPVKWDSIVGAISYMICVDSADPATLNPPAPISCAGSFFFTANTVTVISVPANQTFWVRVRAIGGTSQDPIWGEYTAPIKCLQGVCPPTPCLP